MPQPAEDIIPDKTPEAYFADWESHVFGFGYGTGEEFIIPKLRRFFELTLNGPFQTNYDHRELEKELEPATAWLLINQLCSVDAIDYGTSPRCGWLTEEGKRLREFMLERTNENLLEIVCSRSENDTVCSPDYCNCGPNGYVKGRVCNNPFWPKRT